MSQTFDAVALRGRTIHTPSGFLVFNEGEEAKGIPVEYRQRLIDEGVIPADDAPRAPKAPATPAKAGALVSGPFTATHQGFGKYLIEGPGVDEGRIIQGKKDAQSLIDELNDALSNASAETDAEDAPAD
jgi:hypothetical protein